MTCCAFQLLSPVVQLYWVIKYGTYLTQRWDDESGVNLSHCADVGRSFVNNGPLEDYSQGMQLPEME